MYHQHAVLTPEALANRGQLYDGAAMPGIEFDSASGFDSVDQFAIRGVDSPSHSHHGITSMTHRFSRGYKASARSGSRYL